jgi:mono/diheme cytochrome c family protein
MSFPVSAGIEELRSEYVLRSNFVSRRSGAVLMTLLASVLFSACGNYSSGVAGGGPVGGGGAGESFKSDQELFDGRVQSSLEFCRTCHVPGGVADTDKGRRFMLSSKQSEDYANLKTSWTALGKGVETNRILLKPSGQDPEPHSGGTPWPQESAAYKNMKILLGCWDDPAACAALLAGAVGGSVEEFPLLGNPGKHFFVNQICDGAPDSQLIDWSQDPRRLMMADTGLIDSETYAVHFNDPFELCHVPTLFENQARQNELRVAAGKKPIHTARPYAATCGEWRARVQEGHDWIAMTPTDTPRSGGHGNGSPVGVIAGSSDANSWNKLWQVWGLPERPANFDEDVSERYGHTPAPDHIYNPYPVIDPASGIDETSLLSTTFGGSGRLPLGWAQGKDAEGKYNGKFGLTCFSCHAGQIGAGEIAGRDGNGPSSSYGANPTGSFMGLPNTNTELGVMLADLIHAQQPADYRIPAFGYIPLVNTTRGTNAADTEIEAIVAIRDFDTLNFQHVFAYPLHDSFGDQDPPAWWWLHNKARYLWFGGHSTDSSRGNMYFGSVNGLPGDQVVENEGIFESVHDWTLTVEAPNYPGAVDTALAEQGAILFHEKNLWADAGNADIPQPKGNGSCAGCHGAYSPRYANDKRFLPDPKLAGTNSYTVPLEIIDTDPTQAEGWAPELDGHISTFWWSYPDAMPDYRLPEEKNQLMETIDDYAVLDGVSGSNMAGHLQQNLNDMGALDPVALAVATMLGTAAQPIPGIPTAAMAGRVKGACGFEEKTSGYVTPPLHGVWASAPYFHNGSVPTVWDVLKPADRPAVWRRQRTVSNVHFNGFEHELTGASGAYDFEHLGWKHDILACSDGGQGIPYYSCQPDADLPRELDWLKDTVDGGLLWPTWAVPPPVGDQGLADRMVFNTNFYSKKNRGHEWTKVLTDNERKALVEYLKTL